MSKEKIFKAIYDNYGVFTTIVINVLGNTPYKDDVLSDCIEKLNKLIDEGRVIPSDLIYKGNGEFNTQYFAAIVLNRCIDITRKKKIKTVELIQAIYNQPEEADPRTELYTKLDFIQSKFEKNKNLDIRTHYIYLIWKHHFVNRTSLNKISKEAGISWHSLNSTKQQIKEQIQLWLNEESTRN